MIKLVILILSVGSAGIFGYWFFPWLADKIHNVQEERVKKISPRIDDMFIRIMPHKLALIYTLLPLFLGLVGAVFVKNLAGALIGAAIGLVLPNLVIKNMEQNRYRKFNSQLVDALMLLSNSLKAGLSLIQAVENLVQDMPAPISQEFSIVLAENKMGVSLEESLEKLAKRTPSSALDMLVTSVLLARETGGNLPEVFSRLVGTIRDKNKITENLRNLTLQGRIQGAVMSILPIVFCIAVFSMQPKFFDVMFESEKGRLLLMYATFSEVVGVYLIYRISHIRI